MSRRKNPLTTQSGLQEAIRNFRFDPETPLDQKFEIMTHLFLEQAVEVMSDMSAKDAMIAAGIATDKMNLLRGLPTEIVGSIGILVRIGEKAAAENIPLKNVLTALLESMNEE